MNLATRICHEHDVPLLPDSLDCPEGHECTVWDTYDSHGNPVAISTGEQLLNVSSRFWRGLELLAKERHPSEVAVPARRE